LRKSHGILKILAWFCLPIGREKSRRIPQDTFLL
jgi:hypothetical protein